MNFDVSRRRCDLCEIVSKGKSDAERFPTATSVADGKESQAVEAYSRTGLTRVVHIFALTSCGQLLRLRHRIPTNVEVLGIS